MTAEPLTIPESIAAAAARWPDREGVVDGARRITFGELDRRVRCASGGLSKIGVGAGDCVAIWAPNSLDWIVACAAVQAVGGAVVPLNTRLKGAEAAEILSRVRARFLLTVENFLGNDYRALIETHALPHLERIIAVGEEWDRLVGSAAPMDSIARSGATADIIFTSGTTGRPKGVIATHGQNVRTFRIWGERVGLRAGDRYLLISPFFHTFGYKAGWLACILAGATSVPVAAFDAASMAELIRRERITVIAGAPTIFQGLLELEDAAAATRSLRVAVTGAASVPAVLVARMRQDLGISTVLTGYGLTESTGVVSLSGEHDTPEIVATTAGRPIPGIEVQCVDAAGNAVPSGDEGQILVRGFNVTPGYFEDAEETAKAIDEDGWLHTGDVGRFTAQGCLQITDRLKDMFISGGFNCYPAEIERLLASHPEIAQSAVIGVPDERLGEVGKAFVVPRPDRQLTPEAILAWARAAMANYKAPRFVEIVDSLPVNAGGKVQKHLLRDGHRPSREERP